MIDKSNKLKGSLKYSMPMYRWLMRAPPAWPIKPVRGTLAMGRLRSDLGSEALAVHDRRARLVVLGLGDPHLLESAQRRQDGAADPHGVLPLGGCDHLDLHRRGRQ